MAYYDPFGVGIDTLNWIAVVVFLLATIGYHGTYNLVARRIPFATVKGKVHRYRKDWIENMIQSRNTILAVQTVRNQIMATTWLASSALLVMAFFLTSVLRGTDPLHENALFDTLGIEDFGWLVYKIYAILFIFGFAFLMFLFSVRHVLLFNTLIGVSPELITQIEGYEAAEYLGQLANKSASRFTYGLRATYFALPLIAWLFSIWAFLILTVGIWMWLFFAMDTRHRPGETRHHPHRTV